MPSVPIVEYPQKLLRKRSVEVDTFDDTLKATIKNMADTMYLNQGCGLAAPQIGLARRIAIVDIGDGLHLFINPKVTKKSGLARMEEGCLSVPGIIVEVKRPEKITLAFCDENGVSKTSDFRGFMARAIQHEIDHLDGKLIVDYLNPVKKFILTKVKK